MDCTPDYVNSLELRKIRFNTLRRGTTMKGPYLTWSSFIM